MSTLALDVDGSGALHDRIAASVRRAIADGVLAPGGRLPTAKDLARQLGVNTNTVLRAFRLLSDEGLVELRRGRGATVRGEASSAHLYNLADELLREAARLGISRGELTTLLLRRS